MPAKVASELGVDETKGAIGGITCATDDDPQPAMAATDAAARNAPTNLDMEFSLIKLYIGKVVALGLLERWFDGVGQEFCRRGHGEASDVGLAAFGFNEWIDILDAITAGFAAPLTAGNVAVDLVRGEGPHFYD